MTTPIVDSATSPPQLQTEILASVEQTMEKVKPLIADGVKMMSGAGQLVLKTCVTLNGDGFIALPTFFKALAPANAHNRTDLFIALGFFSFGVISAAIASMLAFGILFWSMRLLVHAVILPMLITQQTLAPASMDKDQTRRLKRGRSAKDRAEPVAVYGMVGVISLCAITICLFIAGSVFSAIATTAIIKPV